MHFFNTNGIRKKINPVIILMLCFLSVSFFAKAQGVAVKDEEERKVDYFEKIYFSGKNKAGISAMYLATLQQLEGKALSPAADKQYKLLVALKEQVFEAPDACDALNIVAIGIYSLDANTAIKEKIKEPSEEVKKATIDDAISAMNSKIDSTSKYNKQKSRVNDANEILNLVNGFRPHKDKPCKDVKPKVVELGFHPVGNAVVDVAINGTSTINQSENSLTRITIKNIKYAQLSVLAKRFEKIKGVNDLNTDNFSNNVAIIEFSHELKLKDIVDKILADNKELKIDVESISFGEAILVVK